MALVITGARLGLFVFYHRGESIVQVQNNWAHAIATQVGVVPISYGPPGVAKTAWHAALAKLGGRKFLQCILRQMMPEDFGGIPTPQFFLIDGVQHQGVKQLLSEPMLRAMHEPTLILLDEFNHAGHDVMGAAQEWINNPPPNCWMAACANPVEQSTAGVELAAPVVNRMCVLEWDVPIDGILAGWESGFMAYPDPIIPLVPSDYLQVNGKYWGEQLMAFRLRYPDMFEDGFPKDPNEACNPWLSYRSMTNCGRLMAACDAVGANKTTRTKLINGTIGRAAGKQFLTHIADMDLPNPEDLLRNPSSLKLPVRFDRTRAILKSVLSAVQGTGADRWEQAFDVLEVAFTQQPEASMAAEGELWRMMPDGHPPKKRNGVAAEMRSLRLDLAKS